MGRPQHPTFAHWLSAELERQQIPRRELARRLATKHPEGANPGTIETYRRAIYRYLDGKMIPTQPTRLAFAEALEVDPSQVPMSDEDEEDDQVAMMPMSRDEYQLVSDLFERLNHTVFGGRAVLITKEAAR